MGEYKWSVTMWQFLVDALEDMKQKMRSMRNLQINGFAMLLQVCQYEY